MHGPSGQQRAGRSDVRVALRGHIAVALLLGMGALIGPVAGAGRASAAGIEITFGGGNKIDMGKLKSVISKNATSAYAPGKIGPVTCPSSRKLKAGDTFSCTVPVEDGVLTIDVVQKDGKGNVHFEARQSVISLDKAEAFVHDKVLAQTKVESVVDCGSTKVKIVAPGGIMDCTATAKDGSVLRVRLTVTDTNGSVTMKSI